MRTCPGTWFHKRTFYLDESEWRAAIFQEHVRPRVTGLCEQIDLDILIRIVRIGPRASRPTIEAVKWIMDAAGLAKPLRSPVSCVVPECDGHDDNNSRTIL